MSESLDAVAARAVALLEQGGEGERRAVRALCGAGPVADVEAWWAAQQAADGGFGAASSANRLDATRRVMSLLDDLEDDYFDLIVTLAPEAHHAALELTRSMAVEVEYWPTADPSIATGTRDQILSAYRDMRDRLKARIETRFAQ